MDNMFTRLQNRFTRFHEEIYSEEWNNMGTIVTIIVGVLALAVVVAGKYLGWWI